jgi:hypothetical protein
MRLGATGDNRLPQLFICGRFMAIENSCTSGKTGAVADG